MKPLSRLRDQSYVRSRSTCNLVDPRQTADRNTELSKFRNCARIHICQYKDLPFPIGPSVTAVPKPLNINLNQGGLRESTIS